MDPIPLVDMTGPSCSSSWVAALLFSCEQLYREMTHENEAKALGLK